MKKANGTNGIGCWVLTDAGLRVWWCGDGFRRVGSCPARCYATRAEAERAANEINEVVGVMGLEAVPTPVRAG